MASSPSAVGDDVVVTTRILVVDNYDSFVFNLVQYLAQLGAEVDVRRNDEVAPHDAQGYAGVLLSPGPGTPANAGVCMQMVHELAGVIPIFGVCLGHQSMGEAFGGRVIRAPEIVHGKTSRIHHDGQGVFAGLPQDFQAIRYHSLIVDRQGLPDTLVPTAQTDTGLIMGLRHRVHPIEGVQFHPESIKTEAGKDLLRNFLNLADTWNQSHERQPRTAS